MSYSSIVPCTAVVRVEARSMIFTMCGIFSLHNFQLYSAPLRPGSLNFKNIFQ